MGPQQMAMMRMRMQQQHNMMRGMEPGMGMGGPGMMANGGGGGMEMIGPNGMMMRSGGPLQRPPMGPMMGGMGMMGGHHPQMQHPMGSRPPPPEYGMTSQVPFSFYLSLSIILFIGSVGIFQFIEFTYRTYLPNPLYHTLGFFGLIV